MELNILFFFPFLFFLCLGEFVQGSLRLVGGNTTAGRVEVYIDNEWGTVCDDMWDLADADVVCKQLGFMRALQALGNAAFGEGTAPIHLDEVSCTGDELNLLSCQHKTVHNCFHFEDAGVVCMNVSGKVVNKICIVLKKICTKQPKGL